MVENSSIIIPIDLVIIIAKRIILSFLLRFFSLHKKAGSGSGFFDPAPGQYRISAANISAGRKERLRRGPQASFLRNAFCPLRAKPPSSCFPRAPKLKAGFLLILRAYHIAYCQPPVCGWYISRADFLQKRRRPPARQSLIRQLSGFFTASSGERTVMI